MEGSTSEPSSSVVNLLASAPIFVRLCAHAEKSVYLRCERTPASPSSLDHVSSNRALMELNSNERSHMLTNSFHSCWCRVEGEKEDPARVPLCSTRGPIRAAPPSSRSTVVPPERVQPRTSGYPFPTLSTCVLAPERA